MDKKWKNGVYLKRSGHFAIVDFAAVEECVHKRYVVDEGKRQTGWVTKLVYPKVKDRPFLNLIGDSLGWGPSKFMNTAEYLGEL